MDIKSLVEKFNFKQMDDSKVRLILGIGILGILMILISSMLPGETPAVPTGTGEPGTSASPVVKTENSDDGDSQFSLDELTRYSKTMEQRAQNILSKISGVGRVWVTITTDQESSNEYATNHTVQSKTVTEKEQSGLTRNTTESTSTAEVVSMGGSGEEHPVLIKRIAPKIAGVLVVAEGAEDPGIKLELSQAASTLLGIPEYKVLVASTDESR